MTDDLPARKSKYGWRPDVPDFRDMLVRPQAVTYPKRGMVARALLPPIREQNDQGSCTGFAVRSHGQCLRTASGQSVQELSPRFLYWNGRALEGTTADDAGCEIRDVIKGSVKKGFAIEGLCRYNPLIWWTRPTIAAYVGAYLDMTLQYSRVAQDLNAMRGCINGGCGFVFGFSVYSAFEGDAMARMGELPMPGPSDKMLGGHAVWAVGYDDVKKAFLIANSWGKNWGIAHPDAPAGGRGYFWLLYDYLLNPGLADDLWVIRKIS